MPRSNLGRRTERWKKRTTSEEGGRHGLIRRSGVFSSTFITAVRVEEQIAGAVRFGRLVQPAAERRRKEGKRGDPSSECCPPEGRCSHQHQSNSIPAFHALPSCSSVDTIQIGELDARSESGSPRSILGDPHLFCAGRP